MSASRSCLVVLLAFLWNSMCLSPCFPNEPETLTTDADWIHFIVAGIKTEREKLASGICQFTGAFKSLKEDEAQDVDGPVEGFLALDNGKVRYDISRPGMVVDPDSYRQHPIEGEVAMLRVTGSTVKGILRKKFADDKARVTFWHGLNRQVTINQSKDLKDRSPTEYMDIRGITFYNRRSEERACSFQSCLDNLAQAVNRRGKVTKVDDGTLVVSWSFQHPVRHGRFSLTVDTKSGFTTSNYKAESAAENEADQADKWRLEWENKTRWVASGGTWVPAHHEWFRPSPIGRAMETMSLDYRWESVNQPISDDLFHYVTFDVPEDVGISDGSSGELVWIQALPIVALPATSKTDEPQWQSRFRFLGISTLTIVLLFIVGRFVYRTRSPMGRAGAQND